jgi:hypothetical protein
MIAAIGRAGQCADHPRRRRRNPPCLPQLAEQRRFLQPLTGIRSRPQLRQHYRMITQW